MLVGSTLAQRRDYSIQIQIQKVFIDSQYMVQQLEQQTPVCH